VGHRDTWRPYGQAFFILTNGDNKHTSKTSSQGKLRGNELIVHHLYCSVLAFNRNPF